MGKIKKGVISGLVGNLVLANYKGTQVVKQRPTNTKPPTAAQIKQRNKMRVVNAFIKNIKPVIYVGYQESAKLSGYNECVSELLSNALQVDNGIYSINYPEVKISRGLLPAPMIESVEINGNAIAISWNKSIRDGKSRKNDEAFVLVKDEGENSKPFECIGLRTDGEGVVNIPKEMSRPCHVWIFFSNPKMFPYESKKKVSDSVYLGKF